MLNRRGFLAGVGGSIAAFFSPEIKQSVDADVIRALAETPPNYPELSSFTAEMRRRGIEHAAEIERKLWIGG